MVINIKRGDKLNLKEITICKLESLVHSKCKSMKTDNVWFETPINNIMCVNYKYGYYTFTEKYGTYVNIRSIKGSDLINMIDQIKSNDVFSYIETPNGKFFKIKSKND